MAVMAATNNTTRLDVMTSLSIFTVKGTVPVSVEGGHRLLWNMVDGYSCEFPCKNFRAVTSGDNVRAALHTGY